MPCIGDCRAQFHIKASRTCDSADSIADRSPHALRGCCKSGAQVSGSLPTRSRASRGRTSQNGQIAPQHVPAGAWPWREPGCPVTLPPRPAVGTGISTHRLRDRSMAFHSWGGSVKRKYQHHAARLLVPDHLIGINRRIDDSLSITRVSAGCALCWSKQSLGLWCICDRVCRPAGSTACRAQIRSSSRQLSEVRCFRVCATALSVYACCFM